MKKFISGFICGAIIFTMAGVFAVNSIYENPYKITVNGVETTIQGYNIDDYSYFKLRDIADVVGGFSVGFDNETIVLSTGDGAGVTEPIVATTPTEQGVIPDPLYLMVGNDNEGYYYTTNDEFQIQVYTKSSTDNSRVVYLRHIADKANEVTGEDRYTALGYTIVDKTTWEDVFEFDSDEVAVEHYYLSIASWLKSLS